MCVWPEVRNNVNEAHEPGIHGEPQLIVIPVYWYWSMQNINIVNES